MVSTPVHIEELLAHASWVRALAGRLVRDPAEADDVTQEVWAAALRSPPRERTNLRGWLNAAVRSAAFSMKRGEQRRRNREEAAFAPREELGPAEFVERAQLHRELVEQVLALAEPHRSLVLARWFESLSVAEAARRLHLTPRVTQLRLDEAYEMLRQRLDRQSGGRAAWSIAFLRWTEPGALHLAAVGSGGALALGEIAMATKLVVSGVAAILGILLFLATRTNESQVPTPDSEPDAAAVETRRTPEVAAPSAPSSDRMLVAPVAEAAASVIDQNAAWRVCVVDSRTNAPLAGATVSVLDSTASWRELSDRGIGFDTLEGLRLRRERCVEAKTGADGCVQLSAPPEHAMVEARLGADWAIATVNQIPDDRCVTLKLAPDRELRVRVVDAAGIAVGGVAVALRRQVNARISSGWKWTDTQPVTGVATFAHFQRRLEQGPGWHAVFAFPLRNEPLIPVGEDTPPEPPITLVLPDIGRVRVRVRAPDGSVPDLDGVDLRLDAFESVSSSSRLWPDGPWARPHVDAQDEALVPWIGLGLWVKAALVIDEAEVVSRSIAGPARPGEEVICDLVLSRPSLTVVTGRFVFRDGQTWPATKMDVDAVIFPDPERPPPWREIEVGNDGRFRMPLHEARPADGTRAFRFTAQHPDGYGQAMALVPLNQDVSPEGLDLGDVLLDFGDLLVSGRVVDAEHRAITGAILSLRGRAVASGKEIWLGMYSAGTVRTGDDGAFALYLPSGEPQPSDELRLMASAKGFATEFKRDVRRGERDIEVVLTQAGALAGSLVLDHELVRDDVALFLLSGGAVQTVTLGPDAKFDVPQLMPGTYSLQVRRRGANGQFEREPAALVAGLLVGAGETCRDPRIQGLRIESVLTTLRIHIVDRALTPLKGATVSVLGLADAGAAMSRDDGDCLLRCKVLPVDIEVSALGYVRQRLVKVSADMEVALDAGFPIRLRADAKPSGSEPKYVLKASLYSVDANGLRSGTPWGPEYTTERGYFDERGELTLRMPAAGVYECDVSVAMREGNMSSVAPAEFSPKPVITVLASSAEQLFELSIPDDAIKAAVERAMRQ